MDKHGLGRTFFVVILLPITLIAQVERGVVPLTSWPAPLFWQPTPAEYHAAEKSDTSSSLSIEAATPVGSLVFVGMTPCRIADTRDGTYPAGFGPPTLVGGASRTFAIQSPSSRCPLPTIAQAYSFNITVVPPGAGIGNVNPSGALAYLTIWPTGFPQPLVSTLNSYLGTVVANAAIVPAGTNGSVNVFVFNNTDLIIDINGYYAPQTGITLAQGTAAGPSLSFSGDPGTGIFSSAAGTLNIAAGGTSRLSVPSSGNVSLTGNLDVSGNETIGGTLGIGTTTPSGMLHVKGGDPVRILGDTTTLAGTERVEFFARSSIFSSDLGGMRIQRQANGDIDTSFLAAAVGTPASEKMRIRGNGNVGIGTINPTARVEVADPSGLKITEGPLSLANSTTATYIQNVNGDLDFFAPNFNFGGSLLFPPAMIIQTGTGNVGIGANTLNARLNVAGGNNEDGVYGVTSSDGGPFTRRSGVHGYAPNGGTGVQGAAAGADGVGVWGSGSNGATAGRFTNYDNNGDGAVGLTINGFGIAGYTCLDYGSSGGAQCSSGGNGTGVYGDNNNSNSNGHAGYFNGRVGITQDLNINGNVVHTSDIRLKQQVTPLGYGLPELLRLRPVTWKWKADPEGPLQLGLVAQEVEEVLPELVHHDADPAQPLRLNYTGLAPVIINAVRQQQGQIEDQQKRITEQNERLEQQRHEIDGLKRLVCLDHPDVGMCK